MTVLKIGFESVIRKTKKGRKPTRYRINVPKLGVDNVRNTQRIKQKIRHAINSIRYGCLDMKRNEGKLASVSVSSNRFSIAAIA